MSVRERPGLRERERESWAVTGVKIKYWWDQGLNTGGKMFVITG